MTPKDPSPKRIPGGQQQGLVARQVYARGDTVLAFTGRPQGRPSRVTIQIAPCLHLDPAGAPWQYSNHACRPNCAVDFMEWSLTALRTISAGEEITWHYLTTEWDMAEPFECTCGAGDCLGPIRGYRHLDQAGRAALTVPVSPRLVHLAETEFAREDVAA